jgi:DNA-binding response OmpR family regulator
VLAYLAHNACKVLLHRQVLQAVWGSTYGDEADYVWTFVQRIRRKIEPDRQHPKYVLTVPGVGYWMPTPDEAAVSGAGFETPAPVPIPTDSTTGV